MSPAELQDLFAPVGHVSVRRMFGGHGIYADGLIFALEAGGTVYLKTDPETQPAFETAGSGPFTYGPEPQRVITSYWRMPDEAFEDPEVMVQWTALARAAARRFAAAKKPTKNKGQAKR
jgi:DNA transformation protein